MPVIDLTAIACLRLFHALALCRHDNGLVVRVRPTRTLAYLPVAKSRCRLRQARHGLLAGAVGMEVIVIRTQYVGSWRRTRSWCDLG